MFNINIHRLTICLFLHLLEYVSGSTSNDEIIDPLLEIFSILDDESDFILDQDDLVLEILSILDDKSDFRLDQETFTFCFLVLVN